MGKSKYPIILKNSMLCFVLVYVVFGFAACVNYDKVESSITYNFPKNTIHKAVVICGCLLVLFTFPLVIYVVNTLLESQKWRFWTPRRKFLSRTLLCLVAVFLSIVVEKFADFISIIGCVGNSANIFILPNLCYLKLYRA